MKNKKNVAYALILPLVVVSGLVLLIGQLKMTLSDHQSPYPLPKEKPVWMQGKRGKLPPNVKMSTPITIKLEVI